jgi:hypothetical protein
LKRGASKVFANIALEVAKKSKKKDKEEETKV